MVQVLILKHEIQRFVTKTYSLWHLKNINLFLKNVRSSNDHLFWKECKTNPNHVLHGIDYDKNWKWQKFVGSPDDCIFHYVTEWQFIECKTVWNVMQEIEVHGGSSFVKGSYPYYIYFLQINLNKYLCGETNLCLKLKKLGLLWLVKRPTRSFLWICGILLGLYNLKKFKTLAKLTYHNVVLK